MNSASQPSREITIVELSSLQVVLVYHQLFQVYEVELGIVSEVLQNVFYCNVAIVVAVEAKEGFSYWFKAVTEFDFKFVFQRFKSFFDKFGLLVFLLVELLSDIIRQLIISIVFVLLD